MGETRSDVYSMECVRPARPEEQGELSRLCVRATRHLGYNDAFIDRAMGSLSIPLPSISAGNVLVSESIEKQITGVVEICPNMAGLVIMQGLFVEPTLWRRGIGKTLFQAMEFRARQLKAGAVYLSAEPSAVPFYERMGAAQIGSVPFSLSPEITLCVMLRVLPAENIALTTL